MEVIGPSELPAEAVERLAAVALASAGVQDGHVAFEFVEPERIAELNGRHRGVEGPTDVLAFPVDEDGVNRLPPALRELGDVVICAEHAEDLQEAVVHGALHLVGMDHETDEGEMLALQSQIMAWMR